MISYPCCSCRKETIIDAIECSLCKNWSHRKCCKLSKKELISLSRSDAYWYCCNCVCLFPYYDLPDDELLFIVGLPDNYDVPLVSQHNFSFSKFNSFDYKISDYEKNIDPDKNLYGHIETKCDYYVTEKVGSTFNSQSGLSVIHFNCRSLIGCFDNLKLFLSNIGISVDIIAISESWLQADDNLSALKLENYNMVSQPRSNKKGGGVVIYYKSCYKVKLNTKLTGCIVDLCEFIGIDIVLDNRVSASVLSVYRTPSSNLPLFTEHLSSLLEVVNKNRSVFLCGDFNIDLLKSSSNANTEDFVNLLFSYGLYPLIDKPTRVTVGSATLIDNIFTNMLCSSTNGIIVTDCISDHFPIVAFVNCIRKADTPQPIVYKYSRNMSQVAVFKNALCNHDWGIVLASHDVDQAYNSFVSSFKLLYDKHCPVERKTVSNSVKPWLTKSIKKACRKKQKLYYKFINNRTVHNEDVYKCYKNKLTSIIRFAEKQYYNNLLSQHSSDIKKTWSILNQVMGRNNLAESVQRTFIDVNNQSISDKSEVAKEFNKFFVNVGPRLANSIPSVSNNDSIYDYMGNKSQDCMFVNPVTEVELTNIVNQFKGKQSSDFDGLDMSIIKDTFSNLVTPFTHICNISLTTGVFPESMKTAKVIPLFKSGQKDTFSNYRPVSLLPQFSKILEKVFYNRLENFVTKSDLLSVCQYGFRKNSSTSLALIDLVEEITDAMDKKHVTIGVFIDLKKAFDTVNHSLLLNKVEHYGIRGVALKWLTSYLSHRKQFVHYNNTSSDLLEVLCGVPQGGIISPLLFLIYINDIENVSRILKILLFADDTSLFCSGKNIDDLCRTINAELDLIDKWFKLNKLSLNVSKTSYMIFSPRSCTAVTRITIRGTLIDRVSVTKFLGVLIDENLNWKIQIRTVRGKLNKCLALLYKSSQLLFIDSLRMIYCALFLPYLDYCCEVWGSGYRSTLECINVCQRKAVRIVSRAKTREHSLPLFAKLKLLRFFDIIHMKTCILLFKGKHKLLPSNLQNRIKLSGKCNRNNRTFCIAYVRTTKKLQSVLIQGPKLFHNLAKEVSESRGISHFKVNIKRYYLNKYN